MKYSINNVRSKNNQGLDLVELGASTGTLVRLVDDLVSIIKMYKQ